MMPMTRSQRETVAIITENLLDQMRSEWASYKYSYGTAVILSHAGLTVLQLHDNDLGPSFAMVDLLCSSYNAWAAIVVFQTRSVYPLDQSTVAVVERAVGHTRARILSLETGDEQDYLPPSSLFVTFQTRELQMVN